MRKARITVLIAISVQIAACIFLVNNAYGNPIPGLHWPTAIKEATHVVLVSEGETIDGVLQTVECWKGDLQPGDILEVPELAQFASPESRMIEEGESSLKHKMVTGNRMILFLTKAQVWADWKKVALKAKWLPAPGFPEPSSMHPDKNARMRISVAWIEDGKLCAYFVDPGPGKQTLRASESSPDEIKKGLVILANTPVPRDTGGYEVAVIEPDPILRAKALLPFIDAADLHVREGAFNALVECGVPALEPLHNMLNNEKYRVQSNSILESYNKAQSVGTSGQGQRKLFSFELEFFGWYCPIWVTGIVLFVLIAITLEGTIIYIRRTRSKLIPKE